MPANGSPGRDSLSCILNREAISQCTSVLKALNSDLGFEAFDIATLSFDLIFPFLLPQLPVGTQRNLASRLASFRKLVENYSQNGSVGEQEKLRRLLKEKFGLVALSREDYEDLVTAGRSYVDSDLLSSYLHDTRRVSYRFDIVKDALVQYSDLDSILDSLKFLSAYLLFDDDIYDLEDDLANGKTTILIEYLGLPRNNLRKAVGEMKAILPTLEGLCSKGSPLLAFARSLAEVHSG